MIYCALMQPWNCSKVSMRQCNYDDQMAQIYGQIIINQNGFPYPGKQIVSKTIRCFALASRVHQALWESSYPKMFYFLLILSMRNNVMRYVLANLVPRVSLLPAPWSEREREGAGRRETLGTRLRSCHITT